MFLAACAAKPGVTPDSLPAESGDELFSRAEKLFDARAYDEAAALYDEYFSRYVDKPLAAAALMKIGIIHALSGDYDKARAAYRKIYLNIPPVRLSRMLWLKTCLLIFRKGGIRM